METRRLTMSHGIWAQRTPRMAYGMRDIAMFHVAWVRGRSLVGLKTLRGVPPVASAAYIAT